MKKSNPKKKKLDFDAVPQVEKMRHTASHVLAQAVLKFYPDTKLGIGPAIDNGFYYDFEFKDPISEEDLEKIEKEMKRIIKADLPMKQEFVSREEAFAYFKEKGQPYKAELLEDIPDEQVSFYVTGDNEFRDMCRGPHVESTGKIGAIKLQSIAGAYWRGDEKKPMLSRIYGLAFETQEELDKHLEMLEEAKKRDHRKLGPQLELFMFSDLVGPALPILLPKGAIIRRELERYIIAKKEHYGHKFVNTPHIGKSDLYIKSKHWQKYDAMMPPLNIDGVEYTLKPMNCPHHFEIYRNSAKSYRDLPLRIAENATVYRYEKSGETNGLLRVRALTQDDSHWFVRYDQIEAEIERALQLMKEIYEDMGLSNYKAEISIRDLENTDKYIGDPKVWENAEKTLEAVATKFGIENKVVEGEAAFYGPKIDLRAVDSLNREWQLMTIQLDFNQPDNFDLVYTDKDGTEKKVAVLHIAILGSIERFLGILIEHYAGAFPLWLSPVQVRILPIAEAHHDYANQLLATMLEDGIRVEVDNRNETLQYRIRESEMDKTPYLLIVGDKEINTQTVSVRARGSKAIGLMQTDEFIRNILKEIKDKAVK
ncbi:MAG TPA: threonine--tRNA ligase [Candidatus Dojkabacteria bacterium]|nr:threonine--tRNA ligase [Candidatus Dojkabacteria bacterium]